MKKIIYFALISTLILSMALGASAEAPETNPPVDIYAETTAPVATTEIADLPQTEPEETEDDGMRWDSLNVNPKEIEIIKLNYPDSTVIVKYPCMMISLFSKTTDVVEMVKTRQKSYIVIEGDEIVTYKCIVDGKLEGSTETTTSAIGLIRQEDLKFISYMNQGKEILSKISSDIEIYNTYYFQENFVTLQSAVCYVTNRGNYLYVSGKYLLTVDEFAEMMKKELARLAENGDNKEMIGAPLRLNALEDLKRFDVNSPTFGAAPIENNGSENAGDGDVETPGFFDNKLVLWGSVSAACVLIIVAAVLVTRRIGKAKRTEE